MCEWPWSHDVTMALSQVHPNQVRISSSCFAEIEGILVPWFLTSRISIWDATHPRFMSHAKEKMAPTVVFATKERTYPPENSRGQLENHHVSPRLNRSKRPSRARVEMKAHNNALGRPTQQGCREPIGGEKDVSMRKNWGKFWKKIFLGRSSMTLSIFTWAAKKINWLFNTQGPFYWLNVIPTYLDRYI